MCRVNAGRTLIVGPAWVGDMVMAHSLIQLIATKLPDDSTVDVLAPGWTAPITARMKEINESLATPFGHGEFGLGARLRLAKVVRARGYERAIVLPNSWKSALVPFAAGIPRRTGYLGEHRYGLLNDWRRLDKERHKLTVERFCALAVEANAELPSPLPVPSLQVDRKRLPALKERLGLAPTGRVLALCPGAEFGPSKQWPAAHFAALAGAWLARDFDIWILGSSKDARVGAEIAATIDRPLSGPDRVANLCGLTTLDDAVDLLATVDAVVANDSGLMHVAGAVDTPLVALYGSTTTAMTPPLGQHASVVEQTLDCRPCFKRVCPLGHTRCLVDLPAERVSAALDQVIVHAASATR